jgi:aerobic carbon-monoxide dehydrogenase large subunit
MIGTNRYIGSPVERVEDFRFLRGRGEFVGDLRREGMLHAAILCSPVAHGRIRNLVPLSPARVWLMGSVNKSSD